MTILGSQTLFYITPLDRAGNPGPNLTRNVIILEPLSIEIANDSFAMSVISAVNITSPEDTDTIMINGSYYAITAGLYGIQITNITNPAFPVSVSNVSLNNLTQVETITIKNSHYALAVKNDSIKIINITNPTSPFVVSEIPSGTINGLSLSITAIDAFTINNTNHYSIISLDSPEINSVIDNRMIKIINITNPKTLDLIYDVSDTEYLNTSTGNIMTIEIDNSYYALLSGAGSESVRILNMTNPALGIIGFKLIIWRTIVIILSHLLLSIWNMIIANDSFAMSVISAVNITSPEDTDTIMINGSYYAITAGLYGIQITNITNPAFPVSVSNVSLNNLTQVETITIKNSHYALAVKNDSIKIINITNPTSPFVVSEIPSGTINGLSLSITAIDAFTINNTNHYSIISLDSPEINSVIDNRMIKIINITNPKTLDLIYDVSDTEYLNTSTGNIMTIEIDNSYYALLSGAGSESVRILNITNPILPDLVYYDFIDAASDTIKVDYLVKYGNSPIFAYAGSALLLVIL